MLRWVFLYTTMEPAETIKIVGGKNSYNNTSKSSNKNSHKTHFISVREKIEVNKTTVRPAGEKRNNKRMIAFPASTTVAPYKLRFTFFIFIINAQKKVKPS